MFESYGSSHKLRLWEQPWHMPSIIEKRPCIHQLLTPFPKFWFAIPNIDDKSMPMIVSYGKVNVL